MVRKLLARKRPGLHADYSREHFERCLAAAFDVRRSEELAGGTRVLYHAILRAGQRTRIASNWYGRSPSG